MDFQKWVEINKPQIVSTGEKIIAFILSCPIFNILVGLISLFWAISQGWNLESVSPEEIAQVFLLTPLPFSIPLSLLTTAIYSRIKSAWYLRNPNSKGYQIAHQQYHRYEYSHESQLEAIRMYDYSVTRIPEILIEVNNLIE